MLWVLWKKINFCLSSISLDSVIKNFLVRSSITMFVVAVVHQQFGTHQCRPWRPSPTELPGPLGPTKPALLRAPGPRKLVLCHLTQCTGQDLFYCKYQKPNQNCLKKMPYKYLKIIFKSNRAKFRHGVCLSPPPLWLHSQVAYWHFQDQLSREVLSLSQQSPRSLAMYCWL